MRKRLRPALTPVELQLLYPQPHEHTRWPDHLIRVEETIALGRELLIGDVELDIYPPVVADLSCGDATIARALRGEMEGGQVILGDFAPGYDHVGPIEETLFNLSRPVDLFILSETLEHLEDPDKVLALIRTRARMLLLSTPVDAFDDTNPEHLWAWDVEEVEEMLATAGWKIAQHRVLDHPAGGIYNFGLWGCR